MGNYTIGSRPVGNYRSKLEAKWSNEFINRLKIPCWYVGYDEHSHDFLLFPRTSSEIMIEVKPDDNHTKWFKNSFLDDAIMRLKGKVNSICDGGTNDKNVKVINDAIVILGSPGWCDMIYVALVGKSGTGIRLPFSVNTFRFKETVDAFRALSLSELMGATEKVFMPEFKGESVKKMEEDEAVRRGGELTKSVFGGSIIQAE